MSNETREALHTCAACGGQGIPPGATWSSGGGINPYALAPRCRTCGGSGMIALSVSEEGVSYRPVSGRTQ